MVYCTLALSYSDYNDGLLYPGPKLLGLVMVYCTLALSYSN